MPSDKFFRVMLRRLWPGWKRALGLIQPETIVRWHRDGFKLYWAWLSRHRNRDREATAAMDFFTVPTPAFGVLYCFFVIALDRRRILRSNTTQHSRSARVVQQLSEAFPYDSAPGYLILDRDAQSILHPDGVLARHGAKIKIGFGG